MELKPNQQKVFDYLLAREGEGLPPTVREICAATGIKSTSTVFAILGALEQAGLIEREGGSSRAVRIAGHSRSVSVPLVGAVAAGQPILAQENVETYLSLPAELARGREIFALRVKGTSMKNAGILDGDVVYAERTAAAEAGDIVVALIGDEATVKRLAFADGRPVLMPENEDFSPIYPEQMAILGKLIASFRRY
ncbi:MAG: transcriptional repressor LexA [Clostridia bacterium]|nr:transcriptional repressor LexA [Clostridia bacterium]